MCISNKIADLIIDTYGDDRSLIFKYFSIVIEKAHEIDKKLIISIEEQPTNFIAQTIECGSSIIIELPRDRLFLGDEHPSFLNSCKNEVADIRYAFVHELGEAEYITERYNKIYDPQYHYIGKWLKQESLLNHILIEIFSHSYIATRLANNSVNKYADTNLGLRALNNDYSVYSYDWKKIIKIIHSLASFPYIYNQREIMKGYNLFESKVDSIMEILRDPHLFDASKNVRDACNKLKDILAEIVLVDLEVN